MKVKRERVNTKGLREVTVELLPGENLRAFEDSRYYRMGGQLDDVMPGYVITEAEPVFWCHIQQQWVDK